MMNSHGLVLLLGLLTAVQAGALESETSRPPGWQAPPRENPEFVVFDMPVSEMERRLGVSLEAMLDRQATAKVHARTDTSRALVILCDWEDHPSNATTHSPAAFDTLLFSQGMVETGSLQEYFLEVSYGSYLLQGDVYGWFTEPVYDPWTYFTEFFAAADPYIDYTTYDLDADGYVDAVYVVHAGPGQEETHDTNDIWSFAIPSGLNYMTEDGVIIDSYACNPEEHADESIMSIRVFAHEGAHVLGLPDLYDYHSKLDTVTYFTPMDDNDHPLVDWCVMGYMGYNIMSYGTRQDPAHLCAWNKIQLEFVVPTVLSESRQRIPLPEVESNPVVYKIENSASGGMEYFLMENRNSNSAAIFDHLDSDFSAYFDWFIPGQNQKDPGIIILHVDDAVSSNSSGPASPHYKVIVEDAGYHPNHPWDGTDEFSDWWHPYEFRIGAAYAGEDSGQTAFTPWSVPNSDWYDGSSDVWITNISNSDSVMTFDLGFGNAWPAIVQAVPSPPETSLTEYDGFTFSVTVEDANLDPVTCLWFENGFLVQESADPTYWYRAGAAESVDTLLVVATDGDLADSLTWVIGAEPLITLAGLVEEGEFRLDWTEGPGASAYWIYGADNEPFFIPGFGPIYEHRLAVLPAGTTSWQSVAGVGDPATNLTYLVIVVDDTETELGRSNRIGEFDYGLAEPR